jgi:hypothetical protein
MRALATAALFLVAGTAAIAGTAAAQNIPDIKPGDTCQKLRATYGAESSQEGPAHVWKQGTLTIQVLVRPGGPCVAGSVNFMVAPGRTVTTRDGIVLGKDTIAAAGLKLKGRIDNTSYVFDLGGGKSFGQIVVPPIASFPFKSTYSWQLNPARTGKLSAPPTLADFTSESATFYTLDPPDPQGMQ